MYYSYVYPYLIYDIEICGNDSNIHLHPLIKLQKRCVRIMTFSHYLESTLQDPRNPKSKTISDTSNNANDVHKYVEYASQIY